MWKSKLICCICYRNCSENTFAGADDANCTRCPEGSTTNGATGSVSIDDCGK